ncbi:MAG: monofunctional biosynthetic peptidoglycan transglycosylase [Gammaproteobacteria bacterium]
MPRRPLQRKKALGARAVQRFLRFIALSTALLLTLTVLLVLALRWMDPPCSSFMLQYSARNRLSAKTNHPLRHQWVPWGDIAPEVKLAVIASEDQRFLTHKGFDFDSMYRAWRDHRGGKSLRGASTITQQTAKNLFLWPSRSLSRKALEAYFTVLIEMLWSKRRILEIYLNIAEFGQGVYGIESASRAFFHKGPSDLTLREAALIVAVLPSPLRYSVRKPSTYLLRRIDWIIMQMRRLGGARYLRGL